MKSPFLILLASAIILTKRFSVLPGVLVFERLLKSTLWSLAPVPANKYSKCILKVVASTMNTCVVISLLFFENKDIFVFKDVESAD